MIVVEGVTSCATREKVFDEMVALKKRFRKRCPYLMVQPTLANPKECKVVVLNGTASYISNPAKQASGGRKFADKHVILAFAEHALRELSDVIKGTISRMLVRVDVMSLRNGRLVVNEFESFEAAYWGTQENAMDASTLLLQFWQLTIAGVVHKFRHDVNRL